jgi:hypothetical protein
MLLRKAREGDKNKHLALFSVSWRQAALCTLTASSRRASLGRAMKQIGFTPFVFLQIVVLQVSSALFSPAQSSLAFPWLCRHGMSATMIGFFA